MECIFCEFINKKKKQHRNNLPFLVLHESKNTISFLSADFPAKEDGHVLVIPKKHFEKIEEIPKYIQHELIEHVSLIIKTLRKNHEGCNFLLNDGTAAGQCVPHSHFHIIPRDKKDNITIEIWKSKKMNKDKFIRLHNTLKKEINRTKKE